MATRAPPLNSPISVEAYSLILARNPACGGNTHQSTQAGPSAVHFQKRGASSKGYPLKELLDGSAAFLEDPHDVAIRAFMDQGIREIRLVIWGPERPRARWEHHVRLVPITSSVGQITSKAIFGKLIALEYHKFCKDSHERRAASDSWQEMHFDDLTLIAVKRLTGNVYQAELGLSPGAMSRVRHF